MHHAGVVVQGLTRARQTVDLVEMANTPEAADLPHADWLGLLIDREATARDDRRLSRRLQAAADSDEAGRVFRFQAGQHSNKKPATVPI